MDSDLTPTPTKSTDNTEIDTPPHTTQPLSALKNHLHLRSEHNHTTAEVEVTYKECMKNHAAAIGGNAVDGCGEFMPLSSQSSTDPTLLTCAACGCHRNFHRRDPDSPTSAITPPFLNFRQPPFLKRFSLSPSPSLSSPPSPVPCAPHGHVFFRVSATADDHHQEPVTPTVENPVGRKRFRTKFSQDQKEKMHSFSVKLGWKMQKCDDAAVKEFCREIGVPKGVLKVWMHNNKNTFGNKKEVISSGGGIANGNGGAGGNNFESENGNGVHLHCSSSSPA
ncbi:hypothetical protein ACS0TY_008910 [Phlomoides rotata]